MAIVEQSDDDHGDEVAPVVCEKRPAAGREPLAGSVEAALDDRHPARVVVSEHGARDGRHRHHRERVKLRAPIAQISPVGHQSVPDAVNQLLTTSTGTSP